MTNFQEAKMGRNLISAFARTPASLHRIIRWSGWAIMAFIVVDLLIGAFLGKEYMLSTKNLRPMIISSSMIFLGISLIIKICTNLQESKTLTLLEKKEQKNQFKQYAYSFAGLIYIIIFAVIARFSYNDDYVNWVINNKIVAISIFALYLLSYIYLVYNMYKVSDELFIIDQLWSNFIAIWFYAIIFPTWWILHRFQISPEPNDWAIYGLTMLVGIVVLTYRQRKLNTDSN